MTDEEKPPIGSLEEFKANVALAFELCVSQQAKIKELEDENDQLDADLQMHIKKKLEYKKELEAAKALKEVPGMSKVVLNMLVKWYDEFRSNTRITPTALELLNYAESLTEPPKVETPHGLPKEKYISVRKLEEWCAKYPNNTGAEFLYKYAKENSEEI